jgi:hypothetical protein
MRTRTLFLTLLLGLALTAAACGSDDDSTEVSSDASSDDASPDTDTDTDDGEADADALPADEGGDADAETDLPLGAGPYPIADVSVTVDLGDGTTTSYRLACLGDTATFTGESGSLDAPAACLALNEAEARDRLLTDQHLDRVCTEIFGGPETATVTGRLDDQPIDTTIDRANGCGIDDWDRLLQPLLPPAAS